MKQLLFLLLFPCLAMAQYQGNGNQKITLGEQTTADGLVYRGLAADTTRKPYVDTMAYILLDTNTNIIWQYKKAVNNAWTRVGGSISSGVTGVLPLANGGTNNTSYISGAIPYSNGTSLTSDTSRLFYDNANKRLGINTSVPTNPITINNNVSNDGIAFNYYNNKFSRAFFKTFSNSTLHPGNISSQSGFFFQRWNTNDLDEANNTAVVDGTGLGIIDFTGNAGGARLQQPGGRISVDVQGGTGTYTGANMRIFTNSSTDSRVTTPQLFISYLGRVGILNAAPSEVLHITGNARITAMNNINDIGANANGVLQAATSDMNLKNTIENSPFGLNEILLLNPVTFLYNDENRKMDSDVKEVGFIAQDVFDVIPNAVSSTGTGDLQLDYRAITAALVKAIQEQQSLIKALEQRILNLENK